MIKKSNKIKISVIATMSSGKSTLINSLLGKELMPSKSEACTAKIIRIDNNSNSDTFKLIKVNGSEKIKEVNVEEINKLNMDESIEEITIEGKIDAFSRFNNIQLIDTPGPNNSLDSTHKKTTMELIKNELTDIMIVVLDGSKLLTDDESYLVQKIIEETEGKIDESNILFVVNKADDFKSDDDIANIKNDILTKLKSFKIKNPKIHFVSAYYYLLSMLEQKGFNLTEDQIDELCLINRKIKRKRFYEYNDVSTEVLSLIEEKLLDKKAIIMVKSGFYGLKLMIEEMILKYDNNYFKEKKMVIDLKCNPYKKENIIKVNNEIYKSKSKLLKYKNKYVYELTEEFIKDLIDELNTKDLLIKFYGLRFDFEDLVELVNGYNEKYNTEIKVIEDKIVECLDKRKEIEDLVKSMINSNIPELKNEELISKMYDALNSPIKVAVIATMSSGKSTLINSILAENLMPSKSGACTSKIVTIDNKTELKNFNLKAIDGIKKNTVLNNEDMKQLNEDDNIREISLEGNIRYLNTINNLQLIDTPGPNNSLTSQHKKTTMDYIKSGDKPIILFVLDGSKLLTDDEAYLISVIAGETKRNEKVDEDRFIFAINKSDDFKNEDSTVKIKEDVKRKLREFGIKNPNIHFVSAQNALLSRLELNGIELTEDEKDDLYTIKRKAKRGSFNFYLESDLRNKVKSDIESLLVDANENDNVIITSGMLGLELTIKEIVSKYKNISLVRNSIEDCSKIIKEKNILNNVRNKISSKEGELEGLENNIKQIREFINKNDVRNEFKNDIENIKFPDTFKEVVKRIHKNLDKLKTLEESLEVQKIGEIDYVKKIEAKRYMNEFSKKYEDITIDLQSEYDRFINTGIYEVGEKLIQEYKNKVEGFIRILNCKDNMLEEYVETAIPNYKDFLKDNTVKKREYYTETVHSGRKWYQFWKPKYVEVKRSTTIEVIDKKEILNFTIKINKDINSIIKEMMNLIEKHKNQAKETLILNLEELNSYIENSLNKLTEVINNKAIMEAAITEENNTLDTIIEINEKMERILEI